ncbi:BREX-1 system adenine-specific DNA-methyltransferase PglX [uncultured Methanobrevibacter sp.]|uniref:BREX-1 system adenine-specific DNA-methyltransferase PglX n=1 Tax=uncultured Methanobrevibacter sp. TaxID=253161 RepID=UPI0025F66707|nr:BREX-1 system adenine-specific DNA-methyltransferase PglX [uncultured Methanobrevibacter sp.]
MENDLKPLINQAELLSKKYSAVVTNPPYMNKFEKNLKDFAKKYYKNYSKDLFSMFIYRNFDFCNENGYNALMTPFVWMFIKNYENLRSYIINNKSISSLIQLEYSAFSEATVPICTFVLSNFDENYAGTYLKLSEFTGGMEVQKEKVLQIISGDEILTNNNKFFTTQSNFKKIPGAPIAFWVDKNIINSFKKGIALNKIVDLKQGLKTGDNGRFLRYWHEINYENIGFNINSQENAKTSKLKWFPYNKGGKYRKWYGNQDYVVNWFNDGHEIKNLKNSNGKLKSRPQNLQFYFKKSLSWSTFSSGNIGFRYYPNGFIFDGTGNSIFTNENFLYILGMLNSNITQYMLTFLSPTLSYEIGYISLIPIIIRDKYENDINSLVIKNIKLATDDWNDYETSWDFESCPLIKIKNISLEENYKNWEQYKEARFNSLKNNENKLNQIFSIIYNFNIETGIENKEISITLANYENDIKSFISYVVGCMFGRYSLDNNGLQFAGGEFNINNYHTFIPDQDNIIPVLDSEYFEDDIVIKFIEFVKTCFGEETLEENLDFIANALAKNKKPSREKIRDYLLKDFFNDHKKTYKKCPIYWQFNSGKENGFNCLVYMHRYEPSLVARIRTDYLHKTQKAIEQRIANNDNIISNSTSKQEITRANKEKAKLQKQLKETQEYDEVLAHIANQNIEIDLDDGVKVNYAKFQNIEIKKEGSKTKKINLLKKI